MIEPHTKNHLHLGGDLQCSKQNLMQQKTVCM